MFTKSLIGWLEVSVNWEKPNPFVKRNPWKYSSK